MGNSGRTSGICGSPCRPPSLAFTAAEYQTITYASFVSDEIRRRNCGNVGRRECPDATESVERHVTHIARDDHRRGGRIAEGARAVAEPAQPLVRRHPERPGGGIVGEAARRER